MYLYLSLYHWQLKLATCVHRTCTNICSAGVRFITQAGIADVLKGPTHGFVSAYRDWTDSLNILHCHHSQPHPLPRLPFPSAKGWPPKLADQRRPVDSCHPINEALFVWGWR